MCGLRGGAFGRRPRIFLRRRRAGGPGVPQQDTRRADSRVDERHQGAAFLSVSDFSQALELPLTERLIEDLRRVLGTYITYILEREPRSAEFMHLVSSR